MPTTTHHHHGLSRKWFQDRPGFLATLMWHYGAERVGRIMRDEDDDFAEDVERWQRLCRLAP